MRAVPWVLACALMFPAVASAQERPVTRTRRVRRVVRDRFAGTWSLGASFGVGGPRGIAGAFLEVRPVRALGFHVGAGVGGTFGPAVDAGVFVSPVGTRGWSLNIGASWSHHFSLVSGVIVPDRGALPGSTDWIHVGVASEFRPSRNLLLRIGVGRAWLLGTGGFAIAAANEVDAVRASLPVDVGTTPADAVVAASRDETLGVWFFHVDVAPAWRF